MQMQPFLSISIRRTALLLAFATLAACAPSEPANDSDAASDSGAAPAADVVSTPETLPAPSAAVAPALVACGDADTQLAMNECFGAEAATADGRLDSLVAELASAQDPARGADLAQVQATWRAYRDAHCRWEGAAFEGGSIRPTVVSTCVASLTQRRIDELKLHLCEGGGMTGACEASRRYDAAAPSTAAGDASDR